MKILLIGGGGRENALARQIFNSASFKETGSILFCAPGSPGIAKYARLINIKADDLTGLTKFAVEEKIELVVVGPEIPLSLGITDMLEAKNIKVFGPSKKASEIESSKIFAKGLMKKYNVPTASFNIFDKGNINEFESFLNTVTFPLVLKADGLAAGKGVIIALDKNDSLNTAKEFLEENVFGDSGKSFVAEEYLEGQEASLFIITDGKDYVILPSSQDHKRIGEGDTGKNTGGMGAYAPAEHVITYEIINKVKSKIIEPVLNGMAAEGSPFKGCLYCGLMISPAGEPFVIEFNCRFGDPETQAVLPLIKSDFLELITASAADKISSYKLEVEDKHTCCIVLASKGYPDDFEKGKVISGISENDDENCIVFHSGTGYDKETNVISSGGRVLSVVCKAGTLKEAINNAYKKVQEISFENKYYRKDIGLKGLKLAGAQV